ncbi:MAG: PAS domain-containing protein, partial [Candidatus Acidiferrum sp.]
MRLNLFWKFALSFLALLVSVLLAVDYFAERALRTDYERTGFEQLAAIARIAEARPPHWTPASPGHPEDLSALHDWVAQMASSGARVTAIAPDGRVLADSQSDAQTSENQATRPEILEAVTKGEGRSVRQTVAVARDLLYYAVRLNVSSGAPFLVRFALPVETVDEVLSAFRHRLWFASTFILLIAGGISLLFSRSLTDRVERLREFSRRVAEGDFRPLPRDSSGDALEALGISLNRTAARLDRTIQTLTEERNLSSAILGSMVEGVAVVNGSERLLFANPGFAEILGLDVPPTT